MTHSGQVVDATPQHEKIYQDLIALINKHAGALTAIEVLAVAANIVGKLAAMQDQRLYTGRDLEVLIANNIALGNSQVLKRVFAEPEGRA